MPKPDTYTCSHTIQKSQGVIHMYKNEIREHTIIVSTVLFLPQEGFTHEKSLSRTSKNSTTGTRSPTKMSQNRKTT